MKVFKFLVKMFLAVVIPAYATYGLLSDRNKSDSKKSKRTQIDLMILFVVPWSMGIEKLKGAKLSEDGMIVELYF